MSLDYVIIDCRADKIVNRFQFYGQAFKEHWKLYCQGNHDLEIFDLSSSKCPAWVKTLVTDGEKACTQ